MKCCTDILTLCCHVQTVKDLGKDATNSMRSVPKALAYLAVVVVQDALEDAEDYPENPVHARLLNEPIFM